MRGIRAELTLTPRFWWRRGGWQGAATAAGEGVLVGIKHPRLLEGRVGYNSQSPSLMRVTSIRKGVFDGYVGDLGCCWFLSVVGFSTA